MNIVDLAILKKMVAGGGGSGTDNYNDLSNLPQINGETLAGNKTAANLGLQDALTFDSAPTEDSTNPVESGGVYNALAGKQDNLTFDDDPTENSTNPVKSGGVYSALAGKQDNLTFDGVYNASTNKAATESTVTNAIAGLDVSALSVDADETISSISETDGKVSVTKQDIAIASNQVVEMTGYAKPSSAPSNPAIQTSDTANQAFGKLEFKADTNQSNILSVLNRTGKNVVNIQAPTSLRGCTFVEGNNGAVTITNTENWSQFIVNAHVKPNTQYKLVFYTDAISNLPAFDVYPRDHDTEGSSLGTNFRVSNTGTIVKDFTSVSDVVCLNIYPDNQATTVTGTATIRVMICEKTLYDLSNEYTWGIPNYDLTYLQAEDRASLAEVVDSGAKNLLDFANLTFQASSNVTVNKTDTQITVTTNNNTWGNAAYKMTLAAGTYYYSCKISNLTVASGTRACIVLDSGSDGHGTRIATFDVSTGTVSFPFVWTGGTLYIFYYPSYANTANNNAFTAAENMICTKAAFGVSQKFVPYRLPYQTLGNLQWKTYEVSLSSVSFIKSGGGLYYYYFSVTNDFSEVLSVTIAGFSAVVNKGFSAYMEAGKIGLIVYDATDPQSLAFSSGQIWLKVVGFK